MAEFGLVLGGLGSATSPEPRIVSPPSDGERSVVRGLGAGDSYIIYNALEAELAAGAFELLRAEVSWQHMLHKGGEVPRLVAVQGTRAAGVQPIYRHPVDDQPPLSSWTPTAAAVKEQVDALITTHSGSAEPVVHNHALIQLYRSGHDYISEHSDKTLDVRRGTSVVNMSFGATRVLVLRSKRKDANGRREVQRVIMPTNSCFVLGWRSNVEWKHEINRDKRVGSEKRPDELTHNGERLSLTFRVVDTFMREADGRLYGQGAVCKTPAELEASAESAGWRAELKEDDPEMLAMLQAFSKENHEADFDWETWYGRGFNLVNFHVTENGAAAAAAAPNGGGAAAAAATALPLAPRLRVLLASKSPRRLQLLQQLGIVDVVVRGSSFAEDLDKARFPHKAQYAVHTAACKARDVAAVVAEGGGEVPDVLISADTIIDLDGEVLEKPADAAHAARMLRGMSGRWHDVHTGVAMMTRAPEGLRMVASFSETTRVKFVALTDADVDAYVATGESMGKAGGYGIQGFGAALVERIEGDYNNVVGLPLHSVSRALARLHAAGELQLGADAGPPPGPRA